jgi:hypothetical protein
MTMIGQLTEHDRIELLARERPVGGRAGKNYVVSHSSVQLRIHTDEGISVY